MALGSSGRRIVVEFIGDASSLSGATSSAEKSLTGFRGNAQKAGAVAGRVLAGGLLLAGAAAVKATQAAADDQAAQSQLAQQLRQAAGASDAQIASTEDWITAQGKATGISDDELRPALARLATATGSVSKAQKLAALAQDVSIGSGKSYQQVTEALAKAQNGNIGALGRLGIATKDAQGHTKSLSQITQDLADKYKGAAAKNAETAAGKQKILTTQMGELQESIGAKLLPVMVKLTEIGIKVVDWMSRNTDIVKPLAIALGIATGAVWALNIAMSANPISLVIIAIAALVAGLVIAYKKSETFRAIVNAAFSVMKTVVLTTLKAVTAAVGAVVDFIKNHWKLLLAILTGPIGAAAIFIISHWNQIKAKTSAVWNAIKGGISSAAGAIRSTVTRIWSDITGTINNGASRIVETIRGLPGRLLSLAGKFASAGRSIINAFVNGLKGASGLVSDIAGNVWDAVRGLMNSAIDKINAALEFTIKLPGPDFHYDMPNIPHLAKGGVVTRPTLALIGEAGPEAVIPLSRARVASSGGSGSVTINLLSLDPRTAGKYVIDAVRQVERQTGRKLLVSAP